MTTTNRDLVITRGIVVPREKRGRCWTEPALIAQWFTPTPWVTTHAETDMRPGGAMNQLAEPATRL